MAEATQAPPATGTFSWNELMTNDVAGAKKFYTSLLGWTAKDMDMGPAGIYTVFKKGEREAGGMMQLPPDAESPPCWLPYIAVDDVDATAKKAESLGAKICVPPEDIPNVGRFAVATDPTGAAIGFLKLSG